MVRQAAATMWRRTGLVSRSVRFGVLRTRPKATLARAPFLAALRSAAGRRALYRHSPRNIVGLATLVSSCAAFLLNSGFSSCTSEDEGDDDEEEEYNDDDENEDEYTDDDVYEEEHTDTVEEEEEEEYNEERYKEVDKIVRWDIFHEWRQDRNSYVNLPDHVDWVEAGAVTPVTDQDTCECCGAMACVQAVESAHKLWTGKLEKLSTQQVVDCDEIGGGCNGSHAIDNWYYIAKNGLVRDQDYPYMSKVGTCKVEGIPVAATITGIIPTIPESELELRRMVAIQPVMVTVYPNQFFLAFTGDKIIELEDCPPPDWIPSDHGHGVVVVAYGAEPDGRQWWLIKGTWGKDWGNNGFAKLRRDVTHPWGVAGITCRPGYMPTMLP